MNWNREKKNKRHSYFEEQRKAPTGKFTEFTVRTYYFLYKACSETKNKMVDKNITYKRALIEFVYKDIYSEPDHMARSVIGDCITNLKELSYIGFHYQDNRWMIYIKNELDFLLPGEHEKYLDMLGITNDFIGKKDTPCLDEINKNHNIKIYRYKKKCYKCGKETDILTYITYSDSPFENMEYPWDINRALNGQDTFAHLCDPSIEFYGINVIGDIDEIDQRLMKLYPEEIAVKYSSVTKTKYPMNLCYHCGAIQGKYYIYRDINNFISKMEQVELLEECNLDN